MFLSLQAILDTIDLLLLTSGCWEWIDYCQGAAMGSTEAGRVGFEHWEQLLDRLRQLVRIKTTNVNKHVSLKTRE